MALPSGERIGPYEILAPLARGGMGELYRAQDVRLHREVVVKMLSEADAGDSESLVRFDRETRAIAALNHPNILAIHDTGTHHGVPYAVTELLHGETVADRLRTGPLPSARAVELACQIADGLAAAHAMGVIHRDIKPENVFLTNEGRAKILDFGIARFDPRVRTGPLSSASSTSAGLVLGTAGYISPERVRGRKADARSDVFSLGAVFFEMLTGARAFDSDSAVETLGAVLRDDPRKHPRAISMPPPLADIVFRCLEKDPADRYQSARDLLYDLRAHQAGALREAGGRIRFASEPPWKHRRTRLALRAAAGVLLFAVGLWAGSCWQRRRSAAAPARAGHADALRAGVSSALVAVGESPKSNRAEASEPPVDSLRRGERRDIRGLRAARATVPKSPGPGDPSAGPRRRRSRSEAHRDR